MLLSLYAYLDIDPSGQTVLRSLLQGNQPLAGIIYVTIHRDSDSTPIWSYDFTAELDVDILLCGPVITSTGTYSWSLTCSAEPGQIVRASIQVIEQDLRLTA